MQILSRLCLTPVRNEGFRFNAECIGNPIDIVEIGNYLGGIVNGTIIQSSSMECFNIHSAHFGGMQGEFFGIGADSRIERA